MFFEFENTRIRYRDKGTGKAVVLLHGFLESFVMWDEIEAHLSRNFRVISPDLPGHGQSGILAGTPSIDRMAEVVATLLLKLGIENAAVAGHSMGGYVTLALAELYPAITERFMLFHSSAFPDSEATKQKRDMAIKMLKSWPEMFIRQSIPALFRQGTLPRFEKEKEILINEALKGDPKGYIYAARAMRARPDRTRLLKANVPKLFVAGKYDPVIPVETSRRQMALIENGKGIMLEKSGHMGFIEQGGEMPGIFARFVTR